MSTVSRHGIKIFHFIYVVRSVRRGFLRQCIKIGNVCILKMRVSLVSSVSRHGSENICSIYIVSIMRQIFQENNKMFD